MEFWMLAWLIWGAATVVVAGGGFAVIEVAALRRKERGDTLSEKIQELIGVKPKRRRRFVLIPVFVLSVLGIPLGFASWFIPHILY